MKIQSAQTGKLDALHFAFAEIAEERFDAPGGHFADHDRIVAGMPDDNTDVCGVAFVVFRTDENACATCLVIIKGTVRFLRPILHPRSATVGEREFPMGPGSFFRLVAAVFLPAVLWSQPTGVSSQWDLKSTVDSVSRHTSRLRQILDELRAPEWLAAGASSTYLQQLDSAKTQTTGVQNAAANLEREPEKLSLALDTFLRLQGLEMVLGSLVEGTRKYQNPALADLISGIAAENSSSRQQLRQYVVDLAALKEEEYRIMDQEAQRCRGVLTHQARPAPAPVKKKPEGK